MPNAYQYMFLLKSAAEFNNYVYFHSNLFSHAADQLTLIEQSFILIILQYKWGVGIEEVHYSAIKSKERDFLLK